MSKTDHIMFYVKAMGASLSQARAVMSFHVLFCPVGIVLHKLDFEQACGKEVDTSDAKSFFT